MDVKFIGTKTKVVATKPELKKLAGAHEVLTKAAKVEWEYQSLAQETRVAVETISTAMTKPEKSGD